MMRSGRIFLCTVSMAWGALMNGGNAAEENPVKVGVGHVGWEPHLMWYSSGEEDLGDFKETDSELIISLMLSVREPLCFPENANGGKQVLDLLDSSGRKVALVTLDVEQLFQQQKKGITYTSITGTWKEGPEPDISWLRLKGTLRVPLARLVKGDVYELPAEKGTEVYIDVPGSNGGEGEAGEDVVTARTASSSRIVLKEYKKIEYEGKKMVKAEIGLEADAPIELSAFQILNDKNEVLETMTGGMSYSPVESSCRADATYFFKDPGDGKKLRIRPVYRAFRKLVKIPVDIKFGMRGEIRDEPGKKK